MGVILKIESKEEKAIKKDALILIDTIKALNFEKFSLKILELLEIPDQLKIVLRQFQYSAATQNILLTVDQALERFVNLAYENGVKNLNPFMKHMFKYSSNILKELDKKDLINPESELKRLLNINDTIKVNRGDLSAISKILSKVKRNTNRIRGGKTKTKTGELIINEVFVSASECSNMLKNIEAA